MTRQLGAFRIRSNQNSVADAFDHIVFIVADFRYERCPAAARLLCIFKEQGVAFLALPAIRYIQNDEPFVFCCLRFVKSLRIGLVLKNQFIGGLVRAYLVVVDLVIVIFGGQLFALLGRIVTAVIETISLPGNS